ncbi:MAG: addiction module antidote protein, HigA family [Acidobacteria bacterium]|nr:MAG: addiction module antidote protein, HigA family [Acidobacteriota bacterium]REK09671.1 MAG: addiction module antidote protein, HigA family [Acidobacteriota bacterium]
MNQFIRQRQPTTPGEILREEFLVPLGLTQKQLAEHLGCDLEVVNRIVNGRAAVSVDMALELGAALRTSPDFWLNAQQAVDLHEALDAHPVLPEPLVRAS